MDSFDFSPKVDTDALVRSLKYSCLILIKSTLPKCPVRLYLMKIITAKLVI